MRPLALHQVIPAQEGSGALQESRDQPQQPDERSSPDARRVQAGALEPEALHHVDGHHRHKDRLDEPSESPCAVGKAVLVERVGYRRLALHEAAEDERGADEVEGHAGEGDPVKTPWRIVHDAVAQRNRFLGLR